MKDFFNAIQLAVSKFKKLDHPVRIISHLDSDGLTSAAILVSAMQKQDTPFSVSIIPSLTETILQELTLEKYKTYFFLDLGSGMLKEISQALPQKNIFVLDHHYPQDFSPNFTHINPHLFNIDGSSEISGAGVTYFFAKELNKKNISLAHLAIIGAIGDMQENKGFSEITSLILQDAIAADKIEVKTGLRLFGTQTRPLHKILLYSTDPYIPGITGNEIEIQKFLQELNISPDKKIIHLTQEETKKLVTAIILKRLGSEQDPEDVIGSIYLLKQEPEESPTKDAREFSTLLNSCGRLGKPSIGIGVCLNDQKSKQKAIEVLQQFRVELVTSLNWFHSNRNTDAIIEKPNFVIINAENKIRPTIIGTLTSMISSSNLYPDNTILISLAYTPEQDIKISIRISGRNTSINLKQTLNNITQKFGIEAGGHNFAAGSIIPLEKEQEFIKIATQQLTETFLKTNSG